MIERLRDVFRHRTQSGDLYECRDCGTTLDHAVAHCPACRSDEIACYEL